MTFEMLFVYTVTAAAATTDIREFRIPNWLNLMGLFFALFFRADNILNDLIREGNLCITKEIAAIFFGIIVAFVETYPLFLIRGIGAGDVKLLCVLGTLLGPKRITGLIVISYVSAGIIGIVVIIRQIWIFRKKIEFKEADIRTLYLRTADIRPKEFSFHKIHFSFVICAAVIILPFVEYF